jgi:hypothetical protein
LNENEKSLQVENWVRLVSDIQNMFNDVFGFTLQKLELWDISFFKESGGSLVSSVLTGEFIDTNPFVEFITKGLKERLMLKLVGRMEAPAEESTFINFFLRSDYRWGMPHIFFDTQIAEDDLLDVLWKTEKRKEYATALLDQVSHLQVETDGVKRRIVDHLLVSRDFPDEDTLRENGTLMMYLSGPERRLINNLIRNYASKVPNARKRISEVNLKNISSRLYEDQFYKEVWTKVSPTVHSIPGGSLALISDSEKGLPDLLNGLENKMVKPVVEVIPENFLDSILQKAKSRTNFDPKDS